MMPKSHYYCSFIMYFCPSQNRILTAGLPGGRIHSGSSLGNFRHFLCYFIALKRLPENHTSYSVFLPITKSHSYCGFTMWGDRFWVHFGSLLTLFVLQGHFFVLFYNVLALAHKTLFLSCIFAHPKKSFLLQENEVRG